MVNKPACPHLRFNRDRFPVDVQICRKIAEITVSSRKSKYVPRNAVACIKEEKLPG